MKKILVVDDSLFMRTILREKLSKKYKISEAGNGAESLEKFKKEKPDLVLLDIVMPDVTGVDILRSLIKINPDARVIMVTAVGQDAVIEECKKLGARDYIIKPFEEETVASTVERCLS